MSKKTTKAQAVDARLFQQIQPHGGLTFADPSYTRMGDGYCRCLHIYGLPNTLDRHWLTRIFTVSGCICSFDVATEDMAAVKRSINRSIGEEGARAYDAKDYNALYDAQKRQAELQQLYDELERMGEVMKICDFRIFLQAQMLAELEEKTKELQDNLDASGYKNTVLLGEQKTEWQSLYEPFAVTHAKPVTMKGLSLTARQLAEGYPFDYSDLLAELGGVATALGPHQGELELPLFTGQALLLLLSRKAVDILVQQGHRLPRAVGGAVCLGDLQQPV